MAPLTNNIDGEKKRKQQINKKFDEIRQSLAFELRGQSIEYPVLPRGSSISMDSFISHLWFFRVHGSNTTNGTNNTQSVKVVAIPEETINLSRIGSIPSQVKSEEQQVNNGNGVAGHLVQGMGVLGSNNVLVCALCKFVLKNRPQTTIKVPCSHFTGEVKFSLSDLDHRSWSRYRSAYIYSCNEDTHCTAHSEQRRNIYLVEPFHNLRERCFLALKDKIRHVDIFDLNIPVSLQKEYLRFLTTLRKINRRDHSNLVM